DAPGFVRENTSGRNSWIAVQPSLKGVQQGLLALRGKFEHDAGAAGSLIRYAIQVPLLVLNQSRGGKATTPKRIKSKQDRLLTRAVDLEHRPLAKLATGGEGRSIEVAVCVEE